MLYYLNFKTHRTHTLRNSIFPPSQNNACPSGLPHLRVLGDVAEKVIPEALCSRSTYPHNVYAMATTRAKANVSNESLDYHDYHETPNPYQSRALHHAHWKLSTVQASTTTEPEKIDGVATHLPLQESSSSVSSCYNGQLRLLSASSNSSRLRLGSTKASGGFDSFDGNVPENGVARLSPSATKQCRCQTYWHTPAMPLQLQEP